MIQSMFYSILYVLPKNFLSYVFGRIAQIRWPSFVMLPILFLFAKFYKIDLYEAEYDLSEYKSLNDFFTRRLKKGIRPIEEGIVHPADSLITQFGRIKDGSLIQAKGKNYSLEEFLGDSKWLSEKYQDGFFVTYYLCPTDYHRVHAPTDGLVVEVNAIPGALWPVNAWSVQNINNLFAINERVIVTMGTTHGFCSLVMVGATNVGQMTLRFDREIRTNQFWNRKSILKKYSYPITLKKGQEVGTFHMGSTVVMLYEKRFFQELNITLQKKVRLGEELK